MSDHHDSAEEPSIVRRRSWRPRTGLGYYLVALVFVAGVLWWTFAPGADRQRPRRQQGPHPDWTSFLLVVASAALLIGVFRVVNAWCRAKKKWINPHWYLTAITAACAVTGVVLWLVRQDFSGILFLFVATVFAFGLHIFSPFWYHFRTGVYLTDLER